MSDAAVKECPESCTADREHCKCAAPRCCWCGAERQAPRCRCGHMAIWHRVPAGPCEFTGPQSTDGCDCTDYVPTTRLAR